MARKKQLSCDREAFAASPCAVGSRANKLKEQKSWSESDCAFAAEVVKGCLAPTKVQMRGLGRVAPSRRTRPVERLLSTPEAIRRIQTRFPSADLSRLPRHVVPFGHYMALSEDEPITKRRIIKAYLLTRSSVQRQALPKATVCKSYPGYRPLPRHSDPKSVRPEDVMAQVLLTTNSGKRYLDNAERGHFDAFAARDIVKRMTCFGLIDNEQGLFNDMRYAATRLSRRSSELAKALKAPPRRYWAYVKKNLYGVAASKAGFFAALLGRGDIPTFDARERELWVREPSRSFNPGWEEVERLRERLLNFPMQIPQGLERYKVHLVHHALWDAYAPSRQSKTTHGQVIRAMQFAGRPGP